MPWFLKLNFANGKSRILRVEDIIDIKEKSYNYISIFFEHMGGEPIDFGINIEDFCVKVFTDENDRTNPLIEIDEKTLPPPSTADFVVSVTK
jgi:hypothetical protein